MKKGSKKEKPGDDLRRMAEEKVGKIFGSEAEYLAKDPIALLHELKVHQIELEMQNEELRRANVEADELRKRFQELFDFAPMGYFILDENDSIVTCNLAASKLFHKERSLLVGRQLAEFFNAASARAFSYFSRKVRDSEKEEQCELRLHEGVKGGAWLIANGIKVLGEDESRVFILISFTDITERKQIEASLIASEEKFSRVFQAAPAIIGVITMDEGRFVDINNFSTQSLGYRPDDIIGRTIDELGILEEPDLLSKLRGIMEAEGSIRNMDISLRARNDGIRTVLLSADFVVIDGVRHMLIVMRDITERKTAEEEIRRLNASLLEKTVKLDEVNRELDAFNYAVAHDLFNHLNMVGCFCQLVKQTCGDKMSVECRDYVDSMSKSLLNMEKFIEAMLKFSTLSHSDFIRKDFNLSALVLEIALGLKYLTPSRTIELQIAEGVTANGEHSLIRIVMENLLGNAFKFTAKREHAVIKFGVTEKEGETVYFVSDNGSGFDISFADKLFKPFQRLPGVVEHKGYGIGLATVERIIRRHGGRIWAESEPGKGASFFFTLGEFVTR